MAASPPLGNYDPSRNAECVKATPSQSLVSGHPPTWYFEQPIYEDYNDIHSNYDIK